MLCHYPCLYLDLFFIPSFTSFTSFIYLRCLSDQFLEGPTQPPLQPLLLLPVGSWPPTAAKFFSRSLTSTMTNSLLVSGRALVSYTICQSQSLYLTLDTKATPGPAAVSRHPQHPRPGPPSTASPVKHQVLSQPTAHSATNTILPTQGCGLLRPFLGVSYCPLWASMSLIDCLWENVQTISTLSQRTLQRYFGIVIPLVETFFSFPFLPTLDILPCFTP